VGTHGRYFAEWAEDKSVRVVVLSGAGGKAFVSGADISEFEKQRANPEQVAIYNSTSDKAFTNLATFPKPTIAMIRGYCIGGGLGLAICAICGSVPTTRNSVSRREARPWLWLHRREAAGRSRGAVIFQGNFFTARQFDAHEAQMMGIVNRVVPSDDLESYVKKYADTISENAPLTIHAVKVAIDEAVKDESVRDIPLTDALVQKCFDSNDYTEGRKAFMEKRKPVFTGT
jgi:enoyl-CoA hydratase